MRIDDFRYLDDLDLRWRPQRDNFRVLAPFRVAWRADGAEVVHTVEPGQISNGASVPRLLTPLFPPLSAALPAGVVHDDLCSRALMPRRVADRVFRAALFAGGIAGWRVRTMYAFVRAFGWITWKGKHPIRQ